MAVGSTPDIYEKPKNKGGRKGYLEEREMKEVLSLSIWTLKRAFNAPDSVVPLLDKARLASPLVVRAMPQKIDAAGLQNNLMLFFAAGAMPASEVEERLKILTGQSRTLPTESAA